MTKPARHTLRSMLLTALGFALALLSASPAEAQFRTHDLRFVPPVDARIVGFHVYVSANSMSFSSYRDNINFIPTPNTQGVSTYRLTSLEAFDDVYLAVKSYDASGVESAFSNQIVLAAQSACLATGCNDGNPCTIDTCTASGCSFDPVPLRGSSCSDGDAQTVNDQCSANGVCTGVTAQCFVDTDCPAPIDACAGPQACVANRCVSATAPLPNGTSCNDGNATTQYDVCSGGACRGFRCSNDAQCGDGEACNGVERCVANSCVAGTPMNCGDGNVCNGTESCRNSQCVSGTAPMCPVEAAPCFDAFCDAQTGCRVQLHPEGSVCTTAGTSEAGTCSAGICTAATAPPPEECRTAYGLPTEVQQLRSGNPALARTIVWKAPLHPLGSMIRLKLASEPDGAWRSMAAEVESSEGCSATYSATLSGLTPGSRYQFRLSGSSEKGIVWSNKLPLRTAPAATRPRFKFAFFAENGLAASPTSTKAQRVIREIKERGFPLVLGGGGYALSSEAMSSGAATSTADALAKWKASVNKVTARAIFAPVLGDTEVASASHGERAADYADFMAVAGSAEAPHGSYAYDFGTAHFVAVHAPTFGTLLPSTAAGAAHLAWIEDDLARAKTAGARWLVVYLHVDLFSSEANAPASTTVRRALAAIFERQGVNLVLSGDGASYERSHGLKASGTTIVSTHDDAGVIGTATDGPVYVRAGSGGRTSFGRWASSVKPAWSAFRNNGSAIWVRVKVTETELELVARSTTGDDGEEIDVVSIR